MNEVKNQILVIEDSKTDQYLIREALKAAEVGAQIHLVKDGLEATQFIDAADSDPEAPCPDLILLDMNLPKKNGDDVLKHLRASQRCKNTPVLIVSSSDAPRDRAAVNDLSIAGYFRKPSDLAEYMKLGPLVKRLLEAGHLSS